jgi:hypothetical protein
MLCYFMVKRQHVHWYILLLAALASLLAILWVTSARGDPVIRGSFMTIPVSEVIAYLASPQLEWSGAQNGSPQR